MGSTCTGASAAPGSACRHSAALARALAAAGSPGVVVGRTQEPGLHRTPGAGGGGGAARAGGEFSLPGTGALLQRGCIVVSGDTGIMHMATGVGTPVVALFGPTVEAFGFFPYRARSTVVQRQLACRPCSAMGTERCPLGHHRCLVDIVPDEVAAAVQKLVA